MTWPRARRAAGGPPASRAEAPPRGGSLPELGGTPPRGGTPRGHNGLWARVPAAGGLPACVEPARRHAIYTVLDPATAPRTPAEKLVYVADRRGGQVVEPLTERARDAARRHPRFASDIERAIPLPAALEREGFAAVAFPPDPPPEPVRWSTAPRPAGG